MKPLAILVLLATSALGTAQIPDIRIKTDIRYSFRFDADRSTGQAWYDSLSRHSLIGFDLNLEPGLHAFVSERVQKIPHDGDPDGIDEAFVEDTGDWRLGKQVLPFGRGLIRESCFAARSDTFLFLQQLPLKVAACDDATGRPRGIIGRIGSRQVGVNFAEGDNFGVAAETLAIFRKPELTATPIGYHRLVGADAGWVKGRTRLDLEYVGLRQPQSSEQQAEDVAQVAISYVPKNRFLVKAAFAQRFSDNVNMLALEGEIPGNFGASGVGVLRYRQGKFFDACLELRVRY
ncbi:MAG: hypothetical protein JSS72_05360 [Armatimonadetes bacterium]|nr:hypothetical protein [Armatimonadota bacterium]